MNDAYVLFSDDPHRLRRVFPSATGDTVYYARPGEVTTDEYTARRMRDGVVELLQGLLRASG